MNWKHVAWICGAILGAMFLHAWAQSYFGSAQQEQLRKDVQSQVETLKQDLAKNLAQIAADKKEAKTPEQIVRIIPQYVSLPSPVKIDAGPGAAEGSSLKADRMDAPSPANLPDSPSAPRGLYFPPEDVKPLFDKLADCKANELKLNTCQQEVKLQTDRAEHAETVAKGGSFFHRLKSNAKWFVIGAGAGAAALAISKH